MEIWKDLKGYEGHYQVSSLGNVKSLTKYLGSAHGSKRLVKERLLKQAVDCCGYYKVTICKNKVNRTIKVHQLVAMVFLDHTPCGVKIVVNHKNFNRKDNRLENLELVTARENANQKHLKSTSEYVGVYWYKKINKWASKIYINGKNVYLGSFVIEHDAHLAYQKALSKTLLNK